MQMPYPARPPQAQAIYPYFGTKMKFIASSAAHPMPENIAPHQVFSACLYQNERLKYMPMKISAIMTMGTVRSPSQ